MKVLIYGDSLADGLELKQHDTHIESYPGITVSELCRMEDEGLGITLSLQEDVYDAVVLIVGTNDLAKGHTEDEILENLKKLQVACMKHTKQIIIMSIPNFDNSKLWDLECLDNMTQYCEFFEYIHESMLDSDKIHLNKFGKQVCVECLDDMLQNNTEIYYTQRHLLT